LKVVSEDEVGNLTSWFNAFIDKLHSIMIDIAGGADTLSASSKNLLNHSEQMTAGAESITGKSRTATLSAEGMSSNMNSVASTMEQASSNIDMVATAIEEMTVTVTEIAQRAEKGRVIVSDAVSQAKRASSRVEGLGEAAKDIGKVTEAITEISDQTNLLALNATIEAARAGVKPERGSPWWPMKSKNWQGKRPMRPKKLKLKSKVSKHLLPAQSRKLV
jgi:methyl-accepting chemotaxis protein